MIRILVGAATSGSGKTTFTMGLLRALTRRGLRVQPFKCGPDYIDTQFHSIAAGAESVNLDTWMASAEHVREVFAHYSDGADAAVIEGVMGLYDGYNRWKGSSAEIAALLDIPIILIIFGFAARIQDLQARCTHCRCGFQSGGIGITFQFFEGCGGRCGRYLSGLDSAH